MQPNSTVVSDEPASIFIYLSVSKHTIISQGNFRELAFRLSYIEYTHSPERSETAGSFVMMRYTLPYSVPQMIVNSLAEDTIGQRSSIGVKFDRSQKITLEGEFSKYFELYAPTQAGIEALTLLAPDVMQSIMASKRFCDIEIVDTYAYFYWPIGLEQNDTYEAFRQNSEVIMEEMYGKLNSRSLAVENNNTIATVGKNNLKKDNYILAKSLVALFIMCFITNIFFGSNQLVSSVTGYTMMGVVLLGFVLYAYTTNRSYRLRQELKRRNQ